MVRHRPALYAACGDLHVVEEDLHQGCWVVLSGAGWCWVSRCGSVPSTSTRRTSAAGRVRRRLADHGSRAGWPSQVTSTYGPSDRDGREPPEIQQIAGLSGRTYGSGPPSLPQEATERDEGVGTDEECDGARSRDLAADDQGRERGRGRRCCRGQCGKRRPRPRRQRGWRGGPSTGWRRPDRGCAAPCEPRRGCPGLGAGVGDVEDRAVVPAKRDSRVGRDREGRRC